MKKQLSISKFEALNEQELQSTNGGVYLLIAWSIVVPTLIGIAIYGAFMEGYNDGRAAANN